MVDLTKLKITEDKSRKPVENPDFYKEVIFKGSELVGLEYEPVFDFFKDKVANSHKVLDGDFVTTEDGTGIVHIAPGFGEDDQNLCKKNNIAIVCPVDDGGCFDVNSKDLHEIKYKLGEKEETLEIRGKQVFDTNDDVIKYLKGKNLWVKTDQYLHNYPHCWRTDTPLIYKAVSSWYVKVSDFKDRMCELNKQIHWIPEHIKDGQFGKWLENARDWSITRNRFWGAPVPVWNSTQIIGINFHQSPFYSINKEQSDSERQKVISDAFNRAIEYCQKIANILKSQQNFAEKMKKLKQIYNEPPIYEFDIEAQWVVKIENIKQMLDKGYSFWVASSPVIIVNVEDLFDLLYVELNKHMEFLNREKKHRINSKEYGSITNNYQCLNFLSPLKVFNSIKDLETFFKDDYCEDFTKKNDEGSWLNSGQYIKLKDNETIEEARKWNVEKIKSRFKIDNLHRPYIDELVKHTDIGDLKRVDDVLDCWFESGSMPYAQVHYPFEYRDGNGNLIRTAEENKKWFNTHFPCDFVTEYVAQTRGWFYTMVVLATALFDKIPFKNVICHGVMLDKDGQKLSKRLRNYPDPLEMIDIYGSDAMRWLMASSPVVQGGDMRIDKDGKMIADVVKNVLNPIWNAFIFYKQYAELDKIKISNEIDSKNVMDIYILSKLQLFLEKFEKSMDAYNTIDACNSIEKFIDALNNWYIRRNKERFWKKEHDTEKQQAYEVLHFVLKTFATAISPILPFLSEEIYKEVRRFEK